LTKIDIVEISNNCGQKPAQNYLDNYYYLVLTIINYILRWENFHKEVQD